MSPPFFIVGNDRSGTTLLRIVLDRSKEVAIPTESMYVGDYAARRVPPASGPGLADHTAAREFLGEVWRHPKVRLWGLPTQPPAMPSGLSHCEAYRYALEAPYRAVAAREGKSRWGDKTPSYLALMDDIVAVWPDAKFVLIVRDGRDVAVSIRPLPFGANNVWAAARDWSAGIRMGRAAGQRHPENLLTVRYEDFVTDPPTEIRRICAFLGLSFDETMLDVQDTPHSKLESDKAGWFDKLWTGINANSVGRWQLEMSARDQARFHSIAHRELEIYGYASASAPGATAPPRGVQAAWLRTDDLARRIVNFVRLRLIQERGREVRYVVLRKLRRAT